MRNLEVGEIPVPEESVLVVALTLVHVFPCIASIDGNDENWFKVVDAIHLSRRIINCSSKHHPLRTTNNSNDTFPGAALGDGS